MNTNIAQMSRAIDGGIVSYRYAMNVSVLSRILSRYGHLIEYPLHCWQQ